MLTTSRFFMIMSKIFKLLLLISCGLAIACQREGNSARINEYYDLEGLIASQTALLDSLNPSVTKTVQVNNEVETEDLKLKNEWSRELDIFKGANLNKPAFAGRYKPSSFLENGITSIIYEPIDDPVSGIEYLKISFAEDLYDVENVEVFFREENLLYKSVRKLAMNFVRAENDVRILNAYSVTGSQKMVFVGLKTFKVEGIVRLDNP